MTGRERSDILSLKENVAPTERYHIHDGFAEGGFAGSVEADDANRLSLLNLDGNTTEYIYPFLVASPQVRYLQYLTHKPK